jgi:hypothetical protein
MSLCLSVIPMGTNFHNQVFCVWLVDLQTICSKYGLETWLPPNNDIRICLFDMQRSWTKIAIWNLNSKKWRKWCILVSPFLFNICFGASLYAYMCSQWAPIVENKYCMFDSSIYCLLVLNTGWKHDSLQMMTLLYVCSTCSVIELKMRFETWIASNEVNDVYWFHVSYLITVLALFIKIICAHNGFQLSKSVLLRLIGQSADYLWLILAGNVILSKWCYSYMFARHAA